MNALGLSTILRLGCICTSETIEINGIKYIVKELLGEGYVFNMFILMKTLFIGAIYLFFPQFFLHFFFSGFSCVELVEQASTKKKYALKRIKCHSIEDEKVASNEISYCRKLKHPNIIELIGKCSSNLQTAFLLF